MLDQVRLSCIAAGAPVASSAFEDSDATWGLLRAAMVDGSIVAADVRDDATSVLEGARPDTSLAVRLRVVPCSRRCLVCLLQATVIVN